jgi:tRNA G18 (ribose-2'-O)-methylase SpoU
MDRLMGFAVFTCLSTIVVQDKIALIYGNEVTGLSENIISLCSEVVEVPQMGTKHSLNVAVCGGIVCWEVLRKMGVFG